MKNFLSSIFMICILFSCTSDVETNTLSKENLMETNTEESREFVFDCLNTSLVNESLVNLGTVGSQANVLRFSWNDTFVLVCEYYGAHIHIERIPPYDPVEYFSEVIPIDFLGTNSFDIAFDDLVSPHATESFRWRIIFAGKDCSTGTDCESATPWHNFYL